MISENEHLGGSGHESGRALPKETLADSRAESMRDRPVTEEHALEESKGASLGRLCSEMTRDLGTLFRRDVALAKEEFEDLGAAGGAATFGIAVGVGLAGALVLAAAIVLGLTFLLSLILPSLAAAFISAGIVAANVVGGAYVVWEAAGKNWRPSRSISDQSRESLQGDARWRKDRV